MPNTDPMLALGNLIPPNNSHVLIRRTGASRPHNDSELRDDLRAAPPAWFSGPLADPSAADAATAAQAAEARLTAAHHDRVHLPPEVHDLRLRVTRRSNGDPSPSLAATAHEDDRIYGETVAPVLREVEAATLALSTARRALWEALFVISDDLAAARVAAYTSARETAAVQAREHLNPLVEAMVAAHLADEVAAVAQGTARTGVIVHGLPANSQTIADLTEAVDAL